MANFTGRLKGPDLEPSPVLIDIGDGRFRISAGRIHLGSWAIGRVSAERKSIYRFALDIDGDLFEFFPDDPLAFSDTIGAVVDLTESTGRYGLKALLERAAES